MITAVVSMPWTMHNRISMVVILWWELYYHSTPIYWPPVLTDHVWEQLGMDMTQLFHRYHHLARMGQQQWNQQGNQWQPSFPPGNQFNQLQSMQQSNQWNHSNSMPRSSFGLGNISLTTLLSMDSGGSTSDTADGAAPWLWLACMMKLLTLLSHCTRHRRTSHLLPGRFS